MTVTVSSTSIDVLVALSSPLGATAGVGVGVGGGGGGGGVLTVIVMLASSLPVERTARSSTVPVPPSQPYTVSDASEGGSTNRVPEHWLLLHRTAVESDAMPSQVARPAGSHSAVTVVDSPTSMVVAEALSQPRDDGVGVGVAVARLGVCVGVAVAGLGVGVGVAVAGLGVGVGVAVAGLGVGVAVGAGSVMGIHTHSWSSGSYSHSQPARGAG